MSAENTTERPGAALLACPIGSWVLCGMNLATAELQEQGQSRKFGGSSLGLLYSTLISSALAFSNQIHLICKDAFMVNVLNGKTIT